MRALVVDDSWGNRVVIGHCLGDLNFQAVTAAEAVEALAHVKSGPHFDLVVVDLKMPGVDGLEFIRRRRAIDGYSATPVVMISSESTAEDIRSALEAGANEYIVKPFNKNTLVEKLTLLGLSDKGGSKPPENQSGNP